MSDRPTEHADFGFRLNMAEIDPVCDRFLQALAAGGEPRIEDYLPLVGEPDRATLLLELLREELWHLRELGTEPCLAAYLDRFAAYARQVRIAFGEGADGPSPDGASGAWEAGEAPPAPPHLPGFQIRRELGRGGMGIVYLAYEDALDRLVAIKVVRVSAAGAEELARFWREAGVAAGLKHPNIVQIYRIGGEPAAPFIVLEYVAGGSLADRLAGVPQPHRDAAALVRTLARAVHFAAERNVVHRDLKPANILLTEDGTPKITDFGLAKKTDDAGQTRTGQVLGTPSYMAPEQARGDRDVGPGVDIYALGAILYECLTGRPPFRGATAIETLQQVVSNDPVSPRALNPRVPRDLETICLKCLRKEPRQRYDSAADLADDLQRYLDGRPIRARPVGLPERIGRWCRRRPVLAGAVALVALLLVGLVGMWAHYTAELGRRIRAESEARAAEREQRQVADGLRRDAEEQRERSYTELQGQLLLPLLHYAGGPVPAQLVEPLRRMPATRWGWECDRRLDEVGAGLHPQRVLGTHDWGVSALLVSPDGALLLSAGEDGRLLAWDTATGGARTLRAGVWHPGGACYLPAWPPEQAGGDMATALAWLDPGKTAIGATLYGRVLLWRVGADAPAEELAGLDRTVPLTCVAVGPDRRTVAAGDERGRVHLVGLNGGGVRTLDLGRAAVVNLVALPGGAGWLAALHDGTLRLVDPAGAMSREVAREPEGVWDIDLDARGETLAVAGGRLALYHVDAEGRVALADIYRPLAHAGAVPPPYQVVRFSPDGRTVYLVDAAGDLTVRAGAGGREIPPSALVSRQVRDLPPTCPLPLRRRVRGLQPLAGGRALFVGGADTLVTRWVLEANAGRTEFVVPGLTALAFDPAAPAHLWAGTADGHVRLIDSRSGAVLASHQAHEGPVVAVAPYRRAGRVATAGSDGKVCTLEREGGRLSEVGPAIRHPRPLRALAVHARGGRPERRVAATDDEDRVVVWDGANGHKVADRSLAEGEHRAVGGVLGYNADGSLLAVCGPGQSFWVLDADTLDPRPHPPGVVAGRGGTAVSWHPTHPRVVAAGDTAGRVNIPMSLAADPAWAAQASAGYPARAAYPVRALNWSPAGDRLAVLTDEGVWLLAPQQVGLVWRDRPQGPGPFHVAFDPTGYRLLVAHTDGAVTVWETGLDRLFARSDEPGGAPAWDEVVLLRGDEARELHVRTPLEARFDGRGRLGILYSRREAPQERALRVGTWDGQRFDPGPAVSRMPDGHASIQLTHRGSALGVRAGEFFVVFRRPRTDVPSGTAGEPVWYDVARARAAVVGEAGNCWFDPVPRAEPDGSLLLTHYSFGTGRLQLTRSAGGLGATVPLGHHGDGYNHQAASGRDGRLHTVFEPLLADRVGQPLVYLSCPPQAPGEQTREVVDGAYPWGGFALAAGPDGEPAILRSRLAEKGHLELVLLRRRAGTWSGSVVLDRLPGGWGGPPGHELGGLTCDARGEYRAILFHRDHRRLVLLSGREGEAWRVETVVERKAAEVETSWNVAAGLVLDAAGVPHVIVAEKTKSGSWLRLFRPSARR